VRTAAIAYKWRMPGAPADFAAGFTRELRDKAAADGCLPAAARFLKVDGARGWLYPVTTEQGDRYQLFLYFDGSAYQVKVVEPAVEVRDDNHACHLFPTGLVCLGQDPTGGMPTLASAFARSVLWANGFSAYLRTGEFPF
jgi:hypothetical protein